MSESRTLKRYSYRAYPTASQRQLFAQTFGSVRVVYNKYIETNKNQGKLVSYNEACLSLTMLKQDEDYAWLNDVSAIALQQSLKDATQGVRNHFKNPKHFKLPGFKKRAYRQSFRIVNKKSFQYEKLNKKWGGVKLPKMGTLKFRMERELPSEPSSVTVIKTSNGEYEVSFVVETVTQHLPVNEKITGIDMGINFYATLVTHDQDTNTVSRAEIENPRYYRKGQTKLAKLQQAYAHTQKGSNRREKARLRVAKQHQHVANQRKDFIRKLVNVLVHENQVISTETLRVKQMSRKTNHLGKSIMDAGWGLFFSSLDTKCLEYGRAHHAVDTYYPSSKTCWSCGVINQELKRGDTTWVCGSCGTSHDRDVNASINLMLAFGSYTTGSDDTAVVRERINARRKAIKTYLDRLVETGTNDDLVSV